MSDPWGTADCSPQDKLAAIRQRIQQVAAVGVEIVNQLAAPVAPALKKGHNARTRIAKTLLAPVSTELAQLESAAANAADSAPQIYAAPAAQAVQVKIDNSGRDSAQERHDTDQPDLLIIADSDQEWHQRLRAWYSGELDSVLLSPSLTAAVEAREAELRARMAADSHMFNMRVQDYEYTE